MRPPLWLAVIATIATLVTAACLGERGLPRGYRTVGPSGAGGSGGGFDPGTGGECSIAGLCGDEVHLLEFDAPNVYFVLDRSGSMAAPAEGTSDSRLEVVREEAVEMVSDLRALIHVGAAVFPHGDLDDDSCSSGAEVMEVRSGAEAGTVKVFKKSIDLPPSGGTPIAASLRGLEATLAALPERTIVLLLTDGGPNCNAAISCEVDSCIPNIEGVCPPTENCCASDHPQGGPRNCLDQAATVAAVEAVHALGIEVYVIGIPGSEAYGLVLDEMALAGGTAQQGGDTLYHRVDELDALGDLFQAIAAANISCEIPLSDPPEEAGFTNVYFGCEAVPYDPGGGWSWRDETTRDTIVLNGPACVELKSGSVTEVQVATGCPTEQPR